MSGPKKKHHFVPKFYLRNFVSDSETISVFQKSTGKIFGGRVDDYGHENRFYELPDPTDQFKQADKQALEDHLASLEDNFAAVIRGIVQRLDYPSVISRWGNPDYFMSVDEKVSIAHHLVLQSFRTREAREAIRQTSYLMMKSKAKLVATHTGGEIGKKYGPTIDIDISEDYFKLQHLQRLLDHKMINGLVNVCMNKIWLLGINTSSLSIYTSDHPVSQIYHTKGFPWGGRGWLSPGMEVAVPLSPKVMLVLLPRELYSPFLKELHADGITPNRTFELKEEHIQFYNSHQVFQSYDFLFSHQADFYQAEQMLKEQPRFANPYRKRASVQTGWGEEVLPSDWGKRKKRYGFARQSVVTNK